MDISRRTFWGLSLAAVLYSCTKKSKLSAPEAEKKIRVDFERGRHTPYHKIEPLELILRGEELKNFDKINSSKFPLMSKLNKKVSSLSTIRDYWVNNFKPRLGASYEKLADAMPLIIEKIGDSREILAKGFDGNLDDWSGWSIPEYNGMVAYMPWGRHLTLKDLRIEIQGKIYTCNMQIKAQEADWRKGHLSPEMIEVSKTIGEEKALDMVVSPWQGKVVIGVKSGEDVYVLHTVKSYCECSADGIDPTGNGALLEKALNKHRK